MDVMGYSQSPFKLNRQLKIMGKKPQIPSSIFDILSHDYHTANEIYYDENMYDVDPLFMMESRALKKYKTGIPKRKGKISPKARNFHMKKAENDLLPLAFPRYGAGSSTRQKPMFNY